MNRTTWKAVMVSLLLMIGISIMHAQGTGAGSIQGTVTDPKGAVIPGAKIHVVKTATSETFDSVTNSVGFYTVPSLFVGDYNVEITVNGMKKWETSVTVQVGQIAVIDAHMEIGSTSADVTVVADQTTVVNNANATMGLEIEKERIEQIPTQTRILIDKLYYAIPAMEGGNGTQPRINGMTIAAISYTQDGMSIDQRDGGGVDYLIPDNDTVQEMKVETTNSTAASDRPMYVTLSTKSGTNSFHGSAFETNQDYGYGSAHNRNSNAAANKLIHNDFGASVGGPIFLPFLGEGHKTYNGKDKSFFFAAYHGMTSRSSGAPTNIFVPTPKMRTGDFSGLKDSALNTYHIFDPTTTGPGTISSNGTTTGFARQEFNYNGLDTINPGSENKLAQMLWAVTPAANLPGGNGDYNPFLAPNYSYSPPNYGQTWDFTTRLDHHFSEKNTAYLRYSAGHSDRWNMSDSQGSQTTDMIWNGTFQTLKSMNAAASWTHISTPTFYQTIVVGMGYQSWNQTGTPASQGNTDWAGNLGLPNLFGVKGLPTIWGSNNNSAGAQTSIFEGYTQGSNPWRDSMYTNDFEDNLTWVHGRHEVTYGGKWRHDQLRILPDQPKSATVTYTGNGTGVVQNNASSSPATKFDGLAVADFYLGLAGSYASSSAPRYVYLIQQELGAYVQDDYHVRPNLTLNLGLRWQGFPAQSDSRGNQFTSFDFANGAIVTPNPVATLAGKGLTSMGLINSTQALGAKYETTEAAGTPRGLFKNYWYNFLPRFGVNWQPFGDRIGTTLRGGYGNYLFQTTSRNVYQAFNESTPYQFNYVQDYNNATQTDGQANAQLRTKPTVYAGQNSSGVVSLTGQSIGPGSVGVEGTASDFRPDGYREWNVTLEQNLRHHTAVNVSYVGNHGYNLEQLWDYNSTPSDYVWYTTTGVAKPSIGGPAMATFNRQTGNTAYGQIAIMRKTGWSNANMFQFNFQRLYYKGMAFQATYAYGRYFRVGGNGWRDSTVLEPQVYSPGTVPTNDPKELNRIQNYLQDTTSGNANYHQHAKYNWVYDLPVGKGRRFLSHSNKIVDGLVGGWELSGTGEMLETVSLMGSTFSDWGPFSPLHFYGKSKPITDCVDLNLDKSCSKGYYAYNGYIAQSRYNAGSGSTYSGLPSDYATMLKGGFEHQPMEPGNVVKNAAGQVLSGGDTNYPLAGYDANGVPQWGVKLANGNLQPNVSYGTGTGTNPNYRKVIDNPWNFVTNSSLFKDYRFADKVTLKVSGDFFNVFNQMGTRGVNANSGIIVTTSNFISPRVIQLSGRLSW